MSANLIVDLNGTALSQPSVTQYQAAATTASQSGFLMSISGAIIGNGVDMLHADTFCNLAITGQCGSGQLRVQVQVSDTDVSGNYTDPTSGLSQFPTVFQSGGLAWINSGGVFGGIYGSGTSGQFVASGFSCYAAFQRTGRYARANILSGDSFAGYLGEVGFVSQYKTTGSGGGYSLSPGSGSVNV